MAITYKVLGQSNPSATTATTIYTAPSLTQAVISTITVCNQSATNATYRIAVIPSGDTLSAENYVVYDETIIANSTTALTLGITLGAGDFIQVYTSSASVSFNAFGSEVN
jgi:hypothetical protein